MTNNETIKELFKRSKLSQKDYASKHKITYNALTKWFKGERNISNFNLIKIAQEDGYYIKFNNKIIKA